MAPPTDFLRKKHIQFFTRCLNVLPTAYQGLDTNRMTVLFFAIFGLDILGELETVVDAERGKEIIEWIYSLQVVNPGRSKPKQKPQTLGENDLHCDKENLAQNGGNGDPPCDGGILTIVGTDAPCPSLTPSRVATMLGFRWSPSNGVRLSDAVATEEACPYPGTPPRHANDCAHVTMTYNALSVLLMLGDDLKGVDRAGVLEGVRKLQHVDGSFSPTADGGERDVRFLFCAASVCEILAGDCHQGMDVKSALHFIKRTLTYEGGFGQFPEAEAHGGSTFCALASLVLMKELTSLSPLQVETMKRWCLDRQQEGFQGRANKPADCCYSFWVGASLSILDAFHLVDKTSNLKFTLSCQNAVTGGMAKWPKYQPDALHAALGIAGLSLLENDSSEGGDDISRITNSGLSPIHAPLTITKKAYERLERLRRNWKS